MMGADLYCGAGGCTRGYELAGFRMIGCDILPQPRYVGSAFVQMDALELLKRWIAGDKIVFENGQAYGLEDIDFFHASPPCQHDTRAGKQWRKAGRTYPQLIEPTRNWLKQTGRPYVIEGVPGAKLIEPLVLNGATFGLLVRRTRLFECSLPLPYTLLAGEAPAPFGMGRPVKEGMEAITPVGHFSNVKYAREQMGIDWMNQRELSQAIPPAYTEFIGRHVAEHLIEREGRVK